MFDVYCSYNSQDRSAVLEVAKELRRFGLRVWIDVWHLEPGRPFQDALETIVETSRSAAVFVGPDGFGPWQVLEVKALLTQYVRRQLSVIPILLPGSTTRPGLPPFLSEFLWLDLNHDYRTGIDRLRKSITRSRSNNVSIAHGVPRQTPTYVQRQDFFDQTLEALDPNHRVWGAAIDGVGGVGKSSLAAKVAQHCCEERLFERIIWTSAKSEEIDIGAYHTFPVGHNPLINDNLYDTILHSFGEHEYCEAPREVKRIKAHESLKSSDCLLVLDNLETIDSVDEIARFLAYTSNRTKTIVTSRTQMLGRGELRVHLTPMSRPEVRELIDHLSSLDSLEIDDAAVDRLFELIGGIPLAIEWSINQLRSRLDHAGGFLDHLAAMSKTGNVDESDLAFLQFCFQTQYDSLDGKVKRVLLIIGMISESMTIDEIANVAEINLGDASCCVNELLGHSLVIPSTARSSRSNRYTLLPLTRLFIRSILASQNSLTTESLRRYASYRERCGKRKTVCVFTPGCLPVTLPKGATVRDFAYGVHTELGHRFVEAVVRDKKVGPQHEVQTGDMIQVIAGDLEPTEESLSTVHTGGAKRAIRYYLRKPTRSIRAVRRGNALALECDASRCEQEFNAALKLDPRNAWGCNRLGQQVRLNGDLGYARELHRRARAYNKQDPYALVGLAAVEYQSGNVSEAGSFFEQALRIDANYVNAAFGLARCECAGNDYARAFDTLTSVDDVRTTRRRRSSVRLIQLIALAGMGHGKMQIGDGLTKTLKEFNRSVPKSSDDMSTSRLGSHFLYYYAITLALAGSENFASVFRKATMVCTLPGLIREIKVDLRLIRDDILSVVEKTVSDKMPGHSPTSTVQSLREHLEKVG